MTTIRKIWLALGWLWVAVIFYLSLTPHPPEPVHFWSVDKLEHALAYALVMLWFCQLEYLRVRLVVVFVAMGVGIEFLQGMTGYRYFEYADMLANSAGVLLGWWLAGRSAGRILLWIEAATAQPKR
jgi:VanZ family protein